MKKLSVFIVLIIISFQSWTQIPPKESYIISINPFGKDIIPKKIVFGGSVKFKISNVNVFKVNGSTVSKPLNIEFDVPSVFNKDSIVTKNGTSIVDPLQKANKNLKTDFISNYKAFVNTYLTIIQFTQLEDKINNKLTDSIFIRDTAGLKERVKSDYKILYDNSDEVDAKKSIKVELTQFETNYASLKQNYEELNKISALKTETLSGEVKSSDGSTKIIIAKAKIEEKAIFKDEMAIAKKLHDTISNVNNTIKIITKAQAGIDLYHKVKNENFIVYTDAEQLMADAVLLTPALKYANGKVAHEFKPITIRTTQGWKADFSSGYLLSFIGDDNFSVYKDASGSTIGISESNKNEVTHSLGGLAHVYPRWVRGPQPALSAGASLATNGSLGFYGGVSIMFIEKNRLLFTWGYSTLKINRLNIANLTKSTTDNSYQFKSNTDTQIKYDEIYKGAWFVGLTYNLAKK